METTFQRVARSVLRRYPWQRGRGLIGRILLPSPRIPEGAIVVSRDGCRFRMHDNPVYEAIYKYGFYESPQMRVYRNLIRKGDVVLDIGANIGWYTTHFGHWVGSEGRVYGFEPLPHLVRWAREAIEFNDLENICTLPHLGLGAENGECTVYTFAGLNDCHASMTTLGRDDALPHTCRISTLDHFVKQQGIDRIDVMKVDCEGHEREVFAGARQTLAKFKPIVTFEINQDCIRSRSLKPSDVESALRDAGYSDFWSIGEKKVEQVGRLHQTRNEDYVAATSCERVRVEMLVQGRLAA